ncbi:MAG: monooxygenase [Candidatus Tectimicrobiota bacterium]|nr:MAG: monooxygenase [Candidatus Tectomicrobia bacterium]
MRPLQVLIIGAGLGGLTAAACLRRAGFAVRVYEQAPVLGEVGAGIQISPNAVKVLRQIGVAAALDAVAVRPLALEGRDWQSGQVLNRIELGDAFVRTYGAPYYHVHRADLHALLVAAVQRLAPDAICLGARCVGVEAAGERVRVRFANGTAAEGDVVVGADGIHSVVRHSLFGPEAPRFTGMVAFRATVPLARLPAGLIERKGYNWMGPHHHFVHYLLRRGTLVNCVGVCEQDHWRLESWSTEGDLRELRAEFTGWHPTIQALIAAMDRCFKWALYDREPMPRWTCGRVTLLGDACHPMLPFLAQGACMAIEDAYVLARCLQTHAGVEAALQAYEAARKPRVSQVQLGARARGQRLHLADPAAIAERNARFAQDPDFRQREMDWIYRYDVVAEFGPLAAPLTPARHETP